MALLCNYILVNEINIFISFLLYMHRTWSHETSLPYKVWLSYPLQEEYEMILYCNQTTAGRNRKLLDIVSTKGPNGFNEFRNVLLQDFKWLVEILDNTPRPPPKPVKDVQSKGTIIPDISMCVLYKRDFIDCLWLCHSN